ncbi:hypothetical protein Tco_0262635 [Tanacetum coccineum]
MSRGLPPAESFFLMPFINENVLSVIDVGLLSLVQSYMDGRCFNWYMFKKITRDSEKLHEAIVEKECLFPFKGLQRVVSLQILHHDKARNDKSTKRIASALC